MNTRCRKQIGKKAAAMLTVLIGVFSGFTSQAAGDVFSTADSQPDTQTVQFRDSAPYVCTEERILPFPSAKITGLIEHDGRTWVQIDTMPEQENVYLPELDENSGWIYVRSGSAKYGGGEYPILYGDGNRFTATAQYVALSAGRRYSCVDQEGNVWPAYCLQSLHGAADGKQMTMYQDTEDFSSQISQHGLDMASRIVRNGYPLNEAYWKQDEFGGISSDAQEYATQIALWCALRGEAGNDSGFYNLIYSPGTAARNGTRMQVLEMVKTLVSCAESGQDLYQIEPVQITRQESSMTEDLFVERIQLSGNADSVWKIDGLSQATIYQNGTQIDWQSGQWYPAAAATELRIEIPIDQAEGKQAVLTAVTADVRSDASVWWGSGAALVAADGRRVQDMAGIHKIISENVSWKASETLYFPTEKRMLLKKTDPEGNGLPGATFTLYKKRPKSVSDADIVFSGVTAEEGVLRFPYLDEGMYVLEEDAAPQGYIRSEDSLSFVVSPDGIELWREGQIILLPTADGCAELVWTNERRTGSIQIQKLETDPLTGTENPEAPLAGVAFGLFYGADVTGRDGSVVHAKGDAVLDQNGQVIQRKTDADGRLLFTDLPIGYYESGIFLDWIQYELRETEALPGYVPVEASLFSFADAESLEWMLSLTLGNRPNQLIIRKLDEENPEMRLTDAVLQLWRTDENGRILDETAYAETVTTGEDWHLMRIPAGYYILRELKAPFGYCKAEDMLIQVSAEDEMQVIEMLDARRKIQITIRKEDSVSHEPLAGALFEIRNGKGETLEQVETDENGYAVSGLLPFARMENGKFTQEQYYIVEVRAPHGYQIRSEIFAVYFPDPQENSEAVSSAELLITDEKIPEEPVPEENLPEDETPDKPEKKPEAPSDQVIQASVPEVLGITEKPLFLGGLLLLAGGSCLLAGRTGKRRK